MLKFGVRPPVFSASALFHSILKSPSDKSVAVMAGVREAPRLSREPEFVRVTGAVTDLPMPAVSLADP